MHQIDESNESDQRNQMDEFRLNQMHQMDESHESDKWIIWMRHKCRAPEDCRPPQPQQKLQQESVRIVTERHELGASETDGCGGVDGALTPLSRYNTGIKENNWAQTLKDALVSSQSYNDIVKFQT